MLTLDVIRREAWIPLALTQATAAAATSRAVWAVMGPNPPSSPGVSARLRRVVSGIVRLTVPVSPAGWAGNRPARRGSCAACAPGSLSSPWSAGLSGAEPMGAAGPAAAGLWSAVSAGRWSAGSAGSWSVESAGPWSVGPVGLVSPSRSSGPAGWGAGWLSAVLAGPGRPGGGAGVAGEEGEVDVDAELVEGAGGAGCLELAGQGGDGASRR